MTNAELARRYGGTWRAGRRLWSRAEDALLRRRYPHEQAAVLARELGRPLSSTHHRAAQLGLSKSAVFKASPEACRLRRGDQVGKATRFPKGHVPANKGLRRPGWTAGRMADTQFKKGQSRNRMPVGSTRVIEGYIYRKVSAVPYVAYTVNWKQEHVLIWTRANGPVPPGHCLIFLNGDKTDVRLENLECVTRKALMAMNAIHNLPPALVSTIFLLRKLRRTIRRKTEDQGHAEKQD